jgi:subtilase family serine protease
LKTFRVRGRGLLIAGVAVSSAVATGVVAPGAQAAPRAHILSASAPGWTAQAKALGSTPATSTVNFGVLLGLRNSAAAQTELAAISTPGSPDYGKWLTSSAFKASYAPSASATAAVVSWLKSSGFNVSKTLQSGLYVEASGTASQVSKTFATTLKNYDYKGKVLRGNATALSLPASTPAAVVGAVAGVIGVDQGAALKQPADTLPGPPDGLRTGVQPCSAYAGQKIATTKPSAAGKKQPYTVCGSTPKQLQTAYGETPLLASGVTGKGVTVAITDAYAAPTIVKDLAIYSKHYGLPQMKPGQFSQILPTSYSDVDECGGNGWYGEETLDVDAVHSMAPGAKIVYVGGSNCLEGLDNAWAETIDNHVADIVTNSWSDGTDDISLLGEATVDFYTEFSLEAALTGITVNFSSGDDGDSTAGGTDLAAKTVGFPADVPYVTGVGGTNIQIGKNGQRIAEYAWQTAYSQLSASGTSWEAPVYNSGGGGGTSVLYAQPFYQRGVVPASMSEYFSKTPARTVPDISMDGDPNSGLIVGETQVFTDGTYYDEYRIGGTSLSSPLLAGVIAVADQFSHHSLGFINPLYYKLAGSKAIYDTVAPKKPVYTVRTDYTNELDASEGLHFELQSVDVQTTTLKDVKGYDTATGVGAPNGPLFFLGLKALAKH